MNKDFKPTAYVSSCNGNFFIYRTDRDHNKWWLFPENKRSKKEAETLCELENKKIEAEFENRPLEVEE